MDQTPRVCNLPNISYSNINVPSLSLSFLTLLVCQDVRELKRGGVDHQPGQTGVSPWSDLPLVGRTEVSPWSGLPLNRTLYITFSIFTYSSNIFISSFVWMGSTLAEVIVSNAVVGSIGNSQGGILHKNDISDSIITHISLLRHQSHGRRHGSRSLHRLWHRAPC